MRYLRCRGGESVSLYAIFVAFRSALVHRTQFVLTTSNFLAMEDAHTAVLDLDENNESNTFFAVYDGHGGTSYSV
jgi:serine/threonine protein phosphatase PrpC